LRACEVLTGGEPRAADGEVDAPCGDEGDATKQGTDAECLRVATVTVDDVRAPLIDESP
jgi:hypothetical protein